MGKSLIIPEADFSQNQIILEDVWYIDEAINYASSLTNVFYTSKYTTYNICNAVKGKVINRVRIPKCKNTGNVNLYKALYPENSGQEANPVLVDTIYVTQSNTT